MPIPLDHGRRQRPPAGAPPRQTLADPSALARVPLAAGSARRPLRALPLRALLLALPVTARTLEPHVTRRCARLRPGHCHGGPDRYRSAQDLSVAGILRSVLRAARRPPRALPLAAWLLGTLFTSWLAACAPSAHATASASDPLAALASADPSPIYDLAFWVQEQATRSLLWRQAFNFCRLHAALPNCRTVRMASWWGSPPPASASPTAATSPPASASTGPAGTATPPPAATSVGAGLLPLLSATVRPGSAAAPPAIPPGASAAPTSPPHRQPANTTAAAAAPPPTRSPERRHR